MGSRAGDWQDGANPGLHERMTEDTVDLMGALRAFAFMGDLSMGQPLDHSLRVAWLAERLGRALGLDEATRDEIAPVALLRWSGCTANAADVAATIADDVDGRAAMLALQPERIALRVPPEQLPERIAAIAAIHCEVSSLIAGALGLPPGVAAALGCVFEHWDGSGGPRGLVGDAIGLTASLVSLCSELEVLSRVHGVDAALGLLRRRAGVVHSPAFVDVACTHAATWLVQLAAGADLEAPVAANGRSADLALIADVIDLKLAWLLGHSRAVANCAATLAAATDLAPNRQAALRRAGWLQGLGRVAVPNAIWERPGPLTAAEWERVRLSPYWTARAARRIGRLAQEVELASHAFERLDGSGYFRGARGAAMSLEHRILPVATSWVALRSPRPWREALADGAALDLLRREAAGGKFDAQVVEALAARPAPARCAPRTPAGDAATLTAREIDVLRRVSRGDSNKLAAQALGISPSTVRTHLESVFRKLGCNSRAACTLKANISGLL
jgi:HD-GYP domain-containing protein (c-di-GMP phosphodiesterase class II)/DNA-binding CsgD family transcriptional regulator